MLQGRPPGRLRHSWEARCRLVGLMLSGLSPQAASTACGMSRATAYRLRRRFEEGGWEALRDRPSTPRRQPRRLSREAEAEIVAIRQRTHAGPVVIGVITRRPASTVGKVLRRFGCSRLPRPVRDPVRRYERDRPGELIHVDTKKLGRFHVVGKRVLKDDVHRNRKAGWQQLHIAIDDHSRLAYTEVLAGQDRQACAAFLRRAVAWYAEQGSPSSGCSQITPRPTTPTSGATPASSWASPGATHGPTRPAPTAKPKR
jgi:transposase